MGKQEMKVQLVGRREVYDLAFRLSLQIQKAGFQPEVAVAIARGGFVPARYLCDFLDIEVLASVQVKHYDAGAQERQSAVLAQPLSLDIRGKNVLLIDDVNDSGETLKIAVEHIQSQGPAEVKSAVLHEKKNSAVRADFSQQELDEWRWITYPWARVEDLGQFAGRLLDKAESPEELLQLLREKHEMDIDEKQLHILRELGKIEI